jgi:hypothetical protein
MKRGLWIVAALLACACAPAPVSMSAGEASERLARFAAGPAPDMVCTPEGRALLRGAVRAYSAAMAQAGVAWPAEPAAEGETLRSVDAAVSVAFASGLLDVSDFQSGSRGTLEGIVSAYWPQIADLRPAARFACGHVVEMQRTASQLVSEVERVQRLAAQVGRSAADAERLRRQQQRLARVQADLTALAAAVEAEIEAARDG